MKKRGGCGLGKGLLTMLVSAIMFCLAAYTSSLGGSPNDSQVENKSPATRRQLVWDVNFDKSQLNAPPEVSSPFGAKMWDTLKQGGTLEIPFRTFGELDRVRDTRTAMVRQGVCGFKGNACVLEVASNDPGASVGESRGPFLAIDVPGNLRENVSVWKLSFSISAGMLIQMGDVYGVTNSGRIFSLSFYKDGFIRQDGSGENGTVDICPYKPNKPIRFDVIMDSIRKKVTIIQDGDEDSALELDWLDKKSVQNPFSRFYTVGMTTGPHCSTGMYAISNIQLVPVGKENNGNSQK